MYHSTDCHCTAGVRGLRQATMVAFYSSSTTSWKQTKNRGGAALASIFMQHFWTDVRKKLLLQFPPWSHHFPHWKSSWMALQPQRENMLFMRPVNYCWYLHAHSYKNRTKNKTVHMLKHAEQQCRQHVHFLFFLTRVFRSPFNFEASLRDAFSDIRSRQHLANGCNITSHMIASLLADLECIFASSCMRSGGWSVTEAHQWKIRKVCWQVWPSHYEVCSRAWRHQLMCCKDMYSEASAAKPLAVLFFSQLCQPLVSMLSWSSCYTKHK